MINPNGEGQNNFDGKLAENVQFVVLSENGTLLFFSSDQELDHKLREIESMGDARGKWHVFKVDATVDISGRNIEWNPVGQLKGRR